MQRITSLATGLLLAPGLLLALASVSNGQDATALARAFAEWKLVAATEGVDDEAKAELVALRAKAEGTTLASDIDARLEALRQSEGESTATSEDPALRAAVEEAIAAGNVALLSNLGPRVNPILERLAKQVTGTEKWPNDFDLLEWLLRVDAERGVRAALALLRSTDVVRKSYAARALDDRRPFRRNQLWAPIGETDWELRNPEFADIPEAMFAPPALEPYRAAKTLSDFATHGLLDERYRAAFDEVAPDMSFYVVPRSFRPTLVELMSHPDREVRIDAVAALAKLEDPTPILDAANDSDFGVRLEVARYLHVHPLTTWQDATRANEMRVYTTMNDTPRLRAVAAALAKDPNYDVRKVALTAIEERVRTVGQGLLTVDEIRAALEACNQGEERVRVMQIVSGLPKQDRLEAILAAVDVEAAIPADRRTIPGWLGMAFTAHLPVIGDEGLWAIAKRLGERDALSYNVSREIYRTASNAAQRDLIPSLDGLVEWALRFEVESVGAQLAAQIRNGDRYTKETSASRAGIIRLVTAGSKGLFGKPDRIGLQVDLADLMPLVRDEALHPAGRYFAMYCATDQHADKLSDGDFASMIELMVDAPRPREAWSAIRRLEDEAKINAFIARAVAERRLSDDLFNVMVARDIDLSLANAIDERWPMPTWNDRSFSGLYRCTIDALVRESRTAVDPRLVQHVHDHPRIRYTLAESIRVHRHPPLLSLVATLLEVTRPSSEDWKIAVDAASGYFNDEAAALLLQAARDATTSADREVVMAALDQMTAWRDAAAAWEKSKSTVEKRARAVDELVKLYGDDAKPIEVRAEALRGLGLLDAAEELPLLLGALGSDVPEFAAAAREAVDRLNAKDE